MMLKVRQERPKRVGNYTVGAAIGMGATGTVYRGEHVETGQLVAIKMVSTQSMKEEFIKSIKKEMYLLKKISHENIVKYIDFIQTEYHYAIILELIESGSLYGIIKKFGPIQEPLVVIFIKQVSHSRILLSLHVCCLLLLRSSAVWSIYTVRVSCIVT